MLDETEGRSLFGEISDTGLTRLGGCYQTAKLIPELLSDREIDTWQKFCDLMSLINFDVKVSIDGLGFDERTIRFEVLDDHVWHVA